MRAVAQYRMLEDLGFTTYLYIEKDLVEPFSLQTGYRLVHTEQATLSLRPQVLVINNMAVGNPRLARRARKLGCKVFYILHEPFQGIHRCLDEGLKKQPKLVGVHVLNLITCRSVDAVLLPSDVSLNAYQKYMAWSNGNYKMFPLVYSDDGHDAVCEQRRHFSFIGAFVRTHAADSFLDFIRYAIERDDDISFEITTRFSMADRIKGEPFERLRREGRLVVTEGHDLSESEIASAYGRALCVWGAYRSSIQSGVAISSMQMGAPLIATRTGIFEQLGEGVQLVSSPNAFEEIYDAYRKIAGDVSTYSSAARQVYVKKYDYRNFLDLAAEVFGDFTREADNQEELR